MHVVFVSSMGWAQQQQRSISHHTHNSHFISNRCLFSPYLFRHESAICNHRCNYYDFVFVCWIERFFLPLQYQPIVYLRTEVGEKYSNGHPSFHLGRNESTWHYTYKEFFFPNNHYSRLWNLVLESRAPFENNLPFFPRLDLENK